ncbi:polysaccharide biosynthesis C-terminal domain-containing protein [Weissella confusa]|uniref:polysaccharide biosynthesis C-terminal domain-containing protein n=1 Tax=Weissella confusa TaxID=1583 RepID=UPI0021A3A538|nr:polysaccharide biosynthesis C-terminal domain-containing protein [Weissella confusa]MCT2911650.1 hypothetical protein [Weissella confusa]
MQLLKVYIQETVMRLTTELVPLFFLTYVAHILQLHALGVQVGTYTLIMLTIAVASTAIRIYAQNELNKMPPDKRGNSSFFWGVWSVQLVLFTTLAAMTWAFIMFTHLAYTRVFILQLLFYIGAILDIAWLYNGINKTRVVVRRDSLVQMLRFVPLIIFVKSPSDLSRFIILLAVTTIFANLLLWIRLPSALVRIRLDSFTAKIHLKSLGFYFAISILPQLSLYLNKAILFVTKGAEDVAVYYSAELLVKVGIALVLGIAMAMMTKVTHQRQNGDSAGVAKSFYDAIEYSSALSIIIAVGVATVGTQAVYWFLGPTFSETGNVLQILAVVIIVASWRYSLALQQMAADRGFRNISVPVQIGAGINVVLTIFLVPTFGMIAAAWAALIGELAALVLQVMLLRQVINIWQLLGVIWRYAVAGVVAMVGLLVVIRNVPGPYPKFSALEAVVGVVLYMFIVYLFSTPVAKTANKLMLMAIKRMYESIIEFIRITIHFK